MCVFGYLKIPDIILSLVSSQKLDWTHTFGTYCICRPTSLKRSEVKASSSSQGSDIKPIPWSRVNGVLAVDA